MHEARSARNSLAQSALTLAGRAGLGFARSLTTSVPLLAILVFNDFCIRFLNPELHGFLSLEKVILDSMDFVNWMFPIHLKDGHIPGVLAFLFLLGFALLNTLSWMTRRSFFFGSRERSLTRFLRRCFEDASRLALAYLRMMVGACFYFLLYHAASYALFQDPARPVEGVPRLVMFLAVCLTMVLWIERQAEAESPEKP